MSAVDTLSELLAPHVEAPTPVAEKSPKAAQANRPVAFRCPDTGQTWSGRGQKPAWIKAALTRGKTLDELRVHTQESDDTKNTQPETEIE